MPLDRIPADTLPPEPAFSQPPELAFKLGAMPIRSTGVPEFLRAHPEWDGRGVLIAILDSGIDPGIDGLRLTSTGERKLLDLRDFSGEGRIPLRPVKLEDDSIFVDGVGVAGAGRVTLFGTGGPVYGGLVREIALGVAPAADVDGNGRVGDSLVVIVLRASDGWVLFADTDRDGSLANERPVHDYLQARETFGWAPGGRKPRLNLAANFAEQDGKPRLDLFFDTSGHGSHVAGIAAGHDIYGVKGFDGVAPGAQLLGLKIANDAQGGISTTGSMVLAVDYAIRFAAARRLPLVINMSFGVGNEAEGAARIDAWIDSVLATHPDVVFTISAGNDGPALSTVGYPGSALLPITVGAILPGPQRLEYPPAREPLAFFSSRGGELAKPDIVTPGVAWSTVPLWKRGDEESSGTSMASPHAAGLAALILSGLRQEDRKIDARAVKQALMVTAQPVGAESFVDAGAGIPNIGSAYRWLDGGYSAPPMAVQLAGARAGVSAAFHPAGLKDGDTVETFIVTQPASVPRATYSLRTASPWVDAPPEVTLAGPKTEVRLHYRRDSLPATLPATAVVSAWPADTMAGPAFRLVTTIGRAVEARGSASYASGPIPAGGQGRLFIAADSGQPLEIAVNAAGDQPVLVFVAEPGGQPLRGAEPQVAMPGSGSLSFRIDGRDVIGGLYEAIAVAHPSAGGSAKFRITSPALGFDARRDPAGVVVHLTGAAADDPPVEASLVGAERVVRVIARGTDTVTTPFLVPAWASYATIDLQMEPSQWPRFTDFGVTLFDSIGRKIQDSPLNYAFGRMEVDFEEGHPDRFVRLSLFPGLTEPGSTERWTATIWIRLYAARHVPLAQVARPEPSPAPSAASRGQERTFQMIPSPWALGDGFYPLGLIALKYDGTVWSREVPLPPPSGPVMR